MKEFDVNVISNDLLKSTLNIVTLLFAIFAVIIVVLLWSGVLHSGSIYIEYLKLNNSSELHAFNLDSIFLDFHHSLKNPAFENSFKVLPILFESKNSVYFNFVDFFFYSVVQGDLYVLEPTSQMILTNLLVFIQIPIFYFILKYYFQRLNSVGKLEMIIRYKLDSDFLADEVTRTIASNIHHELKTPLTALDALILKNKKLVEDLISLLNGCGNEDCEASLKFDKTQKEKHSNLTAHNLQDNIDHQFKLMRESILNMSTTINMIQNLKVVDSTTADIYNIINTSLELFNIGSSYHFTYIIDPEFKKCRLDTLNQHALSNIIINHVKNSVEAKAQIIKFEAKEYLDINKKSFLIFDIIDDGEGISDKILNVIYDIKQTTKVNGTGIGLYVCKKILNTYGGDEKLAYTDKYGTVFELKLPVKHCDLNNKIKE